MRTNIVSCLVLVAAGSLAGCGFKSDLFLPGDREDDPVLEREAVPDQPNPEELSDLSNLTENPAFPDDDENIMLEKVTTVATDGEILVLPSTQDDSQDDPDSGAAEGIPVDLTDLARDVQGSQ